MMETIIAVCGVLFVNWFFIIVIIIIMKDIRFECEHLEQRGFSGRERQGRIMWRTERLITLENFFEQAPCQLYAQDMNTAIFSSNQYFPEAITLKVDRKDAENARS